MDWYRALVAPPASASSPRPDLTGTRRDTASTAATPSSRWDSVHAAASAGSRWDSEASVYERGHRRWDPEASVAERGHRRVPSLSDLPSSASSGGPTTPDRHVSTRPRVGSGSVPPSPSTSPGPALVPRAQKGGSLKGAGRQYSGKGYRSALLGPLHNAAYLAALLLLASAMALSWHALFYKSLLAQMQQQQPFMSSSLATADLLYPDEGAAAASLQGREAQEQGPGSEWGAVEGSGQGIAGNSSLHTRLEAALEVCKRKLLPCSPVLLRCAGKQRRQRLLSNLLPWGVTARSLLQGAAKEAEGAGALKSEACKGQGLRDCKALLRSCRDVSKALKSFLLAAPRRQAQGKALRGSVAASGQGAGHLEAEEGATAALASGGLVGASATVLSINCTYFNRNWDKTCLCPGLAGTYKTTGRPLHSTSWFASTYNPRLAGTGSSSGQGGHGQSRRPVVVGVSPSWALTARMMKRRAKACRSKRSQARTSMKTAADRLPQAAHFLTRPPLGNVADAVQDQRAQTAAWAHAQDGDGSWVVFQGWQRRLKPTLRKRRPRLRQAQGCTWARSCWCGAC